MEKQCCSCKEIKPETDFSFININLGKLNPRCKVCHSKANQVYRSRHREKIKNKKITAANYNRTIIASIKEQAICFDCSKSFHACVFEFDHRNPIEKFYSVSHLVANGYPWTTIEAEIAKCDLICSNCHRIRTFDRLREQFGPRNQKRHKHIDGRLIYRRSGSLTIDVVKQLPCTDCDKTYHTACMDFDHIDPSIKSYDVCQMIHDSMSLEKIFLEISQCDLVCANCHAVRTHNRRQVNG